MISHLWLAGISAAFLATAAQASTEEFRIHVPATTRTCQQEAQSLAQRFQAAAQSTHSKGSCLGTVDATFDGNVVHLYSLMVKYTSENPVDIYTATIGGVVDIISTSPETANYPTYAECASALEKQTANFISETELQAIVSSCRPADQGENGYLLDVVGVGTPKRTLQIFHLNFGAGDPAFAQTVQKFLSTQGAYIVRSKGDAVLYYAAEPFAVRQDQFRFYSNISQCQAQISTVKRIYARSGSKSAPIIRCLIDSQVSGQWGLYGLADGTGPFEETEVETKFYSFTECMHARQGILHDSSSVTTYGAICAPDDFSPSVFTMVLYRD